MLIVRIKSKNDRLIVKRDMGMFADAIARKVENNPYFARFAKRIKAVFSESFVNLHFGGFFPSDKSRSILVRMIAKMLGELGLSDLLMVESASTNKEIGDVVLDDGMIHFKLTQNATILESFAKDGLFDESTIPSKFICELTYQIMDKPVYNVLNPETKCEKAHYLFSIYSNPELKDPYTRTTVDLNKSFVVDRELKAEIVDYMKTVVAECVRKRIARFNDTISRYIDYDRTINGFDKAFRMAAANNCVADMKIIAERISTVNAQDATPTKQYTALHWAVKKCAHDAVRFLLAMEGIDLLIKDANGKTAAELVAASGDDSLKSMFVVRLEEMKAMQEYVLEFRM